MSSPDAAPNPKGIVCPNPQCRGRMFVTSTHRVCTGQTVRYRRCAACGEKLVTREHVLPPRKPRTGK